MDTIDTFRQFRILAADDEAYILDSFKSILNPEKEGEEESRLAELDEKLFGYETPSAPIFNFEITTCLQGKDAVEAVRKSVSSDRPFSVVFLDMRMPPGADGLWTAERIREIDPLINIVIVTAYSDIHPSQITSKVLPEDKLLYIQKPFHQHEIQQFAVSLSMKWQAETELVQYNKLLEKRVHERTAELHSAMEVLKEENYIRRMAEEALKRAEADLQQKAIDLEATNNALQILFRQKHESRKKFENQILFNIKEMVEPFLDKMKKTELSEDQESYVNIIISNLNEILTPFMQNISQKFFRLNPTEIHVANLIKHGKKTKEIAEIMNMSKRTIDFHRDRIREKIGIKNKKANLKVVLHELGLDDDGDDIPQYGRRG